MIKRIYIDPGHSDVDPGAVGYAVERDLNEKTAKYMNEHLQTYYICETKIDPITNNSVSRVAANANAWKAHLLVSIHNNAGGGDGWEGLVYSESRNELGEVFEKYVKEVGQNSRGVKIRTGLGVLRLSNMPAILNEGAFVDNKKDIQDWDEDHELKKLGIAYAEAAAEYLELSKKEDLQKPVVSTPAVSAPVVSAPIVSTPSASAQGGKSIETGSALSLQKVDLFSTSTKAEKSSAISGTYYVWSKTSVNGRIRITNSKSNVGKTGQVTGWIKQVDAQNALQAGSAPSSLSATPYRVRVTANKLNIRKGPGSNYATNGAISDKGIYTIIEEATGSGATKWLKLKSGAGWIASNYTTKA